MKKTILTIIICTICTMGVLGLTIGGMYLFMNNNSEPNISNEINSNNNLNNRNDSEDNLNSENNINENNDSTNNPQENNSTPLIDTNTNNKVTVYVFKSNGCPHCQAAKEYFSKIISNYDYLEVKMFELTTSEANRELLNKVEQKLNIETNYVPFIVISNTYHKEGYGETLNETLENAIKEAHNDKNYQDIVEATIQENTTLNLDIETIK